MYSSNQQKRHLSYQFPTIEEEIEAAAAAFRELSSNDVVTGYIGCMDGFLLRIRVPSPQETGNVKAYFSGHYQCYGIDIQVVSNAKLRFIYVAVAAPGGSNDLPDFQKTTLPRKLQNLPLSKFIIGNNACVCSEKLLTPFSGKEKKSKIKDTYNFYISQLRIRIEMVLARLTSKWRILKSPLHSQLKNVGQLSMCITRLHNFVINQDGFENTQQQTFDDNNNSTDFLSSDITVTNIQSNSIMRDIILEKISTMALLRPQYNVNRNK